VYVPGVLALGVTAPVEASIDNPEGEALKVPPVYAPVPATVGVCAVVFVEQNGPA